MTKKLISLLLALVLVLSLAACGSTDASKDNDDEDEIEAEEEAEEEEEEEEPEKPEEEPAPVEEPAPAAEPVEEPSEPEVVIPTAPNGITLINAAAADGTAFLAPAADAFAAVTAVLPDEDTVVDHWEFNGTPIETGEDRNLAEISLSEAGTLTAVLRPINKVEGINCHLQFLDGDGAAAGEKYTELTFEEAYENPVTGETCEGGMISVCVTADVPNEMAVDYWLINGVRYEFAENIITFIVKDLDEATVYEPVFKDAPHVHYWSMTYNERQHWYYCYSCGATKDYDYHDFDLTGNLFNEEGTSYKLIYTCTVCGYTKYEDIIF